MYEGKDPVFSSSPSFTSEGGAMASIASVP
jgi:hypothetical protein